MSFGRLPLYETSRRIPFSGTDMPSLVATLLVFRLKNLAKVSVFMSHFKIFTPSPLLTFKLRLVPSISVTVHWSLIIRQFDSVSATRRW